MLNAEQADSANTIKGKRREQMKALKKDKKDRRKSAAGCYLATVAFMGFGILR